VFVGLRVWSPAGGWWAQPKNWKRNTALYLTAVAGISIWIVYFVEPKTV
jgi:hypothetical protein